VPDKYKRANGGPRVDPADVQDTAELHWVEAE
jgi:hypothetical protein